MQTLWFNATLGLANNHKICQKGLILSAAALPDCSILAGAKVLVTGATGFTGSMLTRKLVNAGAEVHAIARDFST